MKKFICNFGMSLVTVLLIWPAALIGACCAGWIYDERVEPWLDGHLKTKKQNEEGKSGEQKC